MNPSPLAMGAGIPHHLLLRVEFTPPALSLPIFAVDAAWPQLLGAALARSGLAPGAIILRITLMRPSSVAGRLAGPGEAVDPSMVDAIVDALADGGWTVSANGVSIREEARERDGPLLEIAVYGNPVEGSEGAA